MSSSFTMFYPALNPVERHQKSIQILSKSLIWMVSTKNLWGKIVLRSLWVESCQGRFFLMISDGSRGQSCSPHTPPKANIKMIWDFFCILYRKKTERKVWTISCAHVLTCKSHLAGPPGKYQGNFKLITLRRDIRRAKPSRIFDTQLIVLIQNLGDQFPWNPCDWYLKGWFLWDQVNLRSSHRSVMGFGTTGWVWYQSLKSSFLEGTPFVETKTSHHQNWEKAWRFLA